MRVMIQMNLIEALVGLTIFSLFSLLTWKAEQHTFQHLSYTLKKNVMQLQLNQMVEKNFAYPLSNLLHDDDLDDKYEINITQKNLYREIFLCQKDQKEICLSIVMQNQSEDSLS